MSQRPTLLALTLPWLTICFQTTEYNLPEGEQPHFAHLVNKLNHIQLTMPVPNCSTGTRHWGSNGFPGEQQQQYAISHRYPNEEPEKRQKPARLFCCLMWCKADCQGERLANSIDRKSRIIFPLFFIIFNAIYWYLYTNLHHKTGSLKYTAIGD